MSDDSFLTKYRPETLDDVIGQEPIVKALRLAIEKRAGRAFLFTGPSGTGKTTLARVTAKALGTNLSDLVEVDAATYTGIEAVRSLTEMMAYRPLGGDSKTIVIDEAHALSKQAWSALLKSIEDPPPYGYWMFATTEPGKVPENIQTRCLRFDLKPVMVRDLTALLKLVAELEALPIAPDAIALCAREANGSPRQALANLSVAASAGSEDDAAALLRGATTSSAAFDLARAIFAGKSWKAIQEILNGLADQQAESVRHPIRAYATKVILGAKTEGDAGRALEVLDAFGTPFPSTDGISPLVLAVGKLVLR